ncbi:FHA domain-containing protein [Lacipirellula parvula]|uniref:FHA domain-containing protein n=1 Tax=Lacipirellula parvula TaxID=2650471 RepID=A0A5K7XHE3_9BACT|nr:FHA domain-containing protein [Lacipirellula parvula]BBO34371.1 hypothetical protein PLANPX_3983 [Lacipirellula parvula]
MADPIRITTADLQRPEVNDYVEMQKYLQRDVSDLGRQPWLIRVIYANWFYLSLASMCGGLAAWACLEPWFDDNSLDEVTVVAFLMFPAVVGGIGLFLGAAEGIMCRNLRRAVISGSVGLGVGFAGGMIAIFPAGMIFMVMTLIAVSVSGELDENELPTGVGLLIFMMGRSAYWMIAGIPAGLGQGIALREKKVIINGIVGSLLGGLVGGLLFDPISIVLLTEDGQATYSRAVGFGTIGLFVGLFVGLVEGWTKTAWLLMRKGPLAGKQFIMFKDTTILGSSPKADIYLFKDDAIEPRHATITNRGGRFEIEDCNTPDGTYVNGIPVTRTILRDGDKIVLGKTVLEFSMKETAS